MSRIANCNLVVLRGEAVKKRVLWLQNIVIPQIANKLGMEKCNCGGWMATLFSDMSQNGNIELAVCAPCAANLGKLDGVEVCGAEFYSFYERNINKYDYDVEKRFIEIIERFQPDMVHIFGTEFPHTLAMVRAFNNPDRTVIHIQGLVSVYAKYYFAYLPYSAIKGRSLRDFVKQDNIIQQKRKFEHRGEFEIESIKRVAHVMGRTDWDRACCRIIHPNIKYHYVQEMMREEFYDGKWSYKYCEKHSIFMSQGEYPIKGLHLALEAIYILKCNYPDIRLYIAGSDIIHYKGIKQKIRKTYYAKYIMKLIKKWDLENQIIFLGALNAREMKKRYMASHVFISPSSIENSPNSIAEAMLLGVPIIASDVGGVSSLIKHRENGFLYQADAPYMLAYYVTDLFKDISLADRISENEKKKANILYDRENILGDIYEVYNNMLPY